MLKRLLGGMMDKIKQSQLWEYEIARIFAYGISAIILLIIALWFVFLVPYGWLIAIVVVVSFFLGLFIMDCIE